MIAAMQGSPLGPRRLARAGAWALWLLLTACAAPPAPPAESSALPGGDPILARNLAALAERPGISELGWRQPKERVPSAPAGATSRWPSDPAAFPAPQALQEALDYSNRHQGRGLMIWHAGKLVASQFSEGFGPAIPTATYSMHKTVLALALLAAIEDGIIGGLDDPAGRYIDAWANEAGGQISLRQLLTHASGLQHHALNSSSPEGLSLAFSSRIRETALGYAQAQPPGTQFNYNNVNSQILGAALEDALAARGLRYADYLGQRLWQPLGNGPAALWLEREGGSPRYFAGLEAGLEDWLAIGILLAGEGAVDGRRLLGRESIAGLLAPSAVNPAYGLHIWRGIAWQPRRAYGPGTQLTIPHRQPYLAADLYFLDGFGGQRVYVAPSAQLVVARIGEPSFEYDDSVIPNLLLRGLLEARARVAAQAYAEGQGEGVYQQRLQRLLREARGAGRGTGLAGYDPLAPLPGDPSHQFLPVLADAAPWLDAAAGSELRERMAATNSSALYVWHQGRLVLAEYFGDTQREDLLVSRSLAKPLSVLAVARAMQLGFIDSLDQPIGDFLFEWRGAQRGAISLRQLLQMRSGLAPQTFSVDAWHIMNRAYLHPYHIQAILKDYPLVAEPGARYDYSNANGELIAPIIERATGRSYQDWLGEAVLKPLGAAGGSIWVNRPGGIAHSGCCALLPGETYLRLSILLMQDGIWNGRRLLPEGFVAEMTAPTPENPHAAMGLYVAGAFIERRGAAHPEVPIGKTWHSEPYLDKDLFLFDGNGNQVSYHIPRHQLLVMRLGTAPPEDAPWDNAYLPNFLLRQLQAAGTALEPQAMP